MKNHFISTAIKVVLRLTALFFLVLLTGCMNYYKVKSVNPITSQEIEKRGFFYKYLILHQGNSAWHLSVTQIDTNSISGDLMVLPENRMKYRTTKPKGGNRYKVNNLVDESIVLQEIHLYLKDTIVPEFHTGDNVRIAFSAMKRADVYKKARGRTTASWGIPIAYSALTISVLIIGIIMLGGS